MKCETETAETVETVETCETIATLVVNNYFSFMVGCLLSVEALTSIINLFVVVIAIVIYRKRRRVSEMHYFVL